MEAPRSCTWVMSISSGTGGGRPSTSRQCGRCSRPTSRRDYVIATGKVHSLAQFVELAFRAVGLDWHDHVILDSSLLRPTDLRRGLGDPSLAAEKLGWTARYRMPDVVNLMIEGERPGLRRGPRGMIYIRRVHFLHLSH